MALKDPAAFGVNARLIGTLWPTKIATGRVGAVSEKYWLEIEALLTVDGGCASIRRCYGQSLTCARRDAAKVQAGVVQSQSARLRCVGSVAALTVLNPWHPVRKVRPARRINAPATFQRCFEQIAFAAVSRIVSRGTVTPGVLRLSVYDGLPTTVCTPGEGSA